VVGPDLGIGCRVRLIGYDDYGPADGPLAGVVAEHVPAKGGYLILADGHESPGGFGYREIECIDDTNNGWDGWPISSLEG